MRIKSDKCSKCKKALRASGGRYCLPCKAAYMRSWRPSHPLSPEARLKQNARTYANMYLKRGKLIRQPCEECQSAKSQMHHEDYTKRLEVIWLCRPCHLKRHVEQLKGKL